MKAVHNNISSHLTKKELLEEANRSEAAGDLKKAESFYRKLIKADPHNELAYNRLMIIYRKQKELNEELATIKDAIRAFEDMYAAATKIPESKKVSTLSKAFLKATGLANNKGKLLYLPAPLAKWNRRKTLLEKKLKKP